MSYGAVCYPISKKVAKAVNAFFIHDECLFPDFSLL